MTPKRSVLPPLLALLASCSPAPPMLVEGDACDACRMVISDVRFGGQVTLATGRSTSFDAVECLADYLDGTSAAAIQAVRVSDFESGRLIDADSARFIDASPVASPMGRGVIAVSASLPMDTVVARYGRAAVDLATIRRTLRHSGRDAMPQSDAPLPIR